MDQSDIISNYNSENENIIEELDYQILNQKNMETKKYLGQSVMNFVNLLDKNLKMNLCLKKMISIV